MAAPSSILALKIPWTEEPGGLQSHGVTKSQTRLSNKACLCIFPDSRSLVTNW